MDKFGRSTSGRLSPSLEEQQDSPPIRTRRAASAALSGDVRNARAVCRTKGGEASQLTSVERSVEKTPYFTALST